MRTRRPGTRRIALGELEGRRGRAKGGRRNDVAVGDVWEAVGENSEASTDVEREERWEEEASDRDTGCQGMKPLWFVRSRGHQFHKRARRRSRRGDPVTQYTHQGSRKRCEGRGEAGRPEEKRRAPERKKEGRLARLLPVVASSQSATLPSAMPCQVPCQVPGQVPGARV